MAGRLKPQHMTHRLQVSVGGRDVGDGEEQTGESFSVALDLSPQDDVGMEVFGACEEKQLSETACQAVMEEIGRRFSEYQDSARGLLASMSFSEAFSRLLGMKAEYETFPEAAEKALGSENFVDITAWWHFQEMVGEGLADVTDLSHFADEPAFHFTCPYWTWGDAEAAVIAELNSKEHKAKLFAVGDSQYGYREGDLPNHANGPLPTTNTCRHTMQLTLLLAALPSLRLDFASASIVEIGGGYGNMARLMGAGYGFKDWTIFDMRFMNRLQKHYLEQTLGASVSLNLPAHIFPPSSANRHADETAEMCGEDGGGGEDGVCRAAGSSKAEGLEVNLVDTRHLNSWMREGFAGADILIATSSLSELAMEDFYWYYNHILPHVKVMLYAYSKVWPSPSIVEQKLRLIQRRMTLVSSVESNNNNTVSMVWKQRDPQP